MAAGRFLFQNLASSGTGRRLLFGAHHASAAACAREVAAPPLTRRVISEGGVGTLSRFFHGAAAATAHDPTPAIHGYEAGLGALTNVVHGARAQPAMAIRTNSAGFHQGHAARCFSTMPWARAAASPTSGGLLRSAITLKPAFVNSVGLKRTFSSNPYKINFDDMVLVLYFTGLFLILFTDLIIPSPKPSQDGGRSHYCCSCCCRCKCHSAANHRTQQTQDKEPQHSAAASHSTESI